MKAPLQTNGWEMAFNQMNFRQRIHTLGDPAEQVFELKKPLGKAIVFGWRRPNISMANMPEILRYMPDFYVDGGLLVEALGLGQDGILKGVKVKKWAALKHWNRFAHLWGGQIKFFIWNASTKEYTVLNWLQMRKLVMASEKKGIAMFEVDKVEYYPILWQNIVDLSGWAVGVDEGTV